MRVCIDGESFFGAMTIVNGLCCCPRLSTNSAARAEMSPSRHGKSSARGPESWRVGNV
ncbi:hypothetical protein ACLOJK_040316, partial [Asimina triloba]